MLPLNTSPPNTSTKRIAAAIAAALIALTGCTKKDKGNTFAPPPPPEVIVSKPVERDVTEYLIYSGLVEASETVDLRARVAGFLEKVNFQPGQLVNAGDVLFEIDPRQYKTDVDRARANVLAQKAALSGAENDARLARELADQRAGPEIDAVIKAARRDVAAAEVAKAEAALAEAELNLSYCTITAPTSGRITKNQVDVGNLVGRGEPTLLAQIVQARPAFVTLGVSETDVLNIRRERLLQGGDVIEPGQISPGVWRTCELGLGEGMGYTVPGRIDFVDPKMDTQTGTLSVRTRFENKDGALLPGYFARVRFPMSSRKAMTVPEAALLSDQQGRFAMVVGPKDEVEIKRVEIGELDGDQRVIREGLSPDDRVIVLGVLKARPGSKVTPKTQETAPKGR